MSKISVIVPNWNGADNLADCLDSLVAQSVPCQIIVVDNGSKDRSLEILKQYPSVEVIKNDINLGYAGGVNQGFNWAIDSGYELVAAFNNDAVADKNWLEELASVLDKNKKVGIVTSKLLDASGKHIDSTGDYYSVWGLPYPRGRGETDINKYDDQVDIFGGSGGASLYRVSMLKQIGLFDEDFFAYYEDVDLSFRAQLAGWKVKYAPKAVAYHQISATSSKIKGFAAYQTMKNLPLLLIKNVPRKYIFKVGWRFTLAHILFFVRAISRGQGWMALKGDLKGSYLMWSAYKKRRRIQKTRSVSDEYIWSMLMHDLPPNAKALRGLRSKWWRVRGKTSG